MEDVLGEEQLPLEARPSWISAATMCPDELQGVVVFDVPADTQLASIDLHASPFSGGVTVTLS